MQNDCKLDHIECITSIFDKIFEHDIKERISIEQIAPLQAQSHCCKNCIRQIMVFINAFGVIDMKTTDDSITIAVKSIRAKYFIKSILEYIKSGRQIFGNWDESKGAFPELNENNLFCGPNFLYYMEQKRVELGKVNSTIGHLDSSRAIIKARFKS